MMNAVARIAAARAQNPSKAGHNIPGGDAGVSPESCETGSGIASAPDVCSRFCGATPAAVGAGTGEWSIVLGASSVAPAFKSALPGLRLACVTVAVSTGPPSACVSVAVGVGVAPDVVTAAGDSASIGIGSAVCGAGKVSAFFCVAASGFMCVALTGSFGESSELPSGPAIRPLSAGGTGLGVPEIIASLTTSLATELSATAA